eukprot:7827345-Pyramimonas_sp.AAC.1
MDCTPTSEIPHKKRKLKQRNNKKSGQGSAGQRLRSCSNYGSCNPKLRLGVGAGGSASGRRAAGGGAGYEAVRSYIMHTSCIHIGTGGPVK